MGINRPGYNASDAEKKKYECFVKNDIFVMNILEVLGDDLEIYGSSFSSMFLPFTRSLRCNYCKSDYLLRNL